MFEEFRDQIYLKLGTLHSAPNGFMKRNCVMCSEMGHSPDRRRRFGIKQEGDLSIRGNCFNCGFKFVWTYPRPFTPNFQKFLNKIGFSIEELRNVNFQLLKARATGDYDLDGNSVIRKVIKTWEPVDLPGAKSILTLLHDGHQDINFLSAASYCLDRDIKDLSGVMWSPDMSDRVIFPLTYRGKTHGYSARLVGESSSDHPKYMKKVPEAFVYQLDKQYESRHKYVILCEGTIDAYQIGGISSLGAITKEQADVVDSLGKKVIVSPDRDKSGSSLVNMALERGWSVSFPPWSDDLKDAADAVKKYGKLLTIQSIVDFREENPVKIKLKRRFD